MTTLTFCAGFHKCAIFLLNPDAIDCGPSAAKPGPKTGSNATDAFNVEQPRGEEIVNQWPDEKV